LSNRHGSRAGVQPPLSKSDAVWVCAAEPVVPAAETTTCAAVTAELADTVSEGEGAKARISARRGPARPRTDGTAGSARDSARTARTPRSVRSRPPGHPPRPPTAAAR